MEDPIPYQLLMHRAIIAFLTLKAYLPPKHASRDTLIDCYHALLKWSNTGQQPDVNAITSYPAAQIALASIIDMRRSRAALIDPDDPEDAGLAWLIDLCGHLHAMLADPGQEIDEP
jgi:hypothetical protein